MPSSKISRACSESLVPPMSLTWPTVPTRPTRRPSRNTGVTTAMSNRCPAQSHGSLVTSTSPGTSVSAGYFASSAFTARGRQRLNTGMARGECASGSPLASSSSQAKSCASEMISENAVRQTVSHISSTTVTSRLHMISSEIGSASMRAIASASGVPGATSACGGAATPIASRRLRLRVDLQACRRAARRWSPRAPRRSPDLRCGRRARARSGRRPAASTKPSPNQAWRAPLRFCRRGGAAAWSSDSSGVGPTHAHAEADRLDRGLAVERGVAPGVDVREGGADRAERGLVDRAGRQRHVDLVHLPDEAHVGACARP